MRVVWILFVLLLPQCAMAAHPDDPWEGWNRGVFELNETLDSYAAQPIAQAYRNVTPQPVDDAITNIFSNLGDPFNAINALLQGKFTQALSDTSRFVVNSTVGVLGIFDVASHIGLDKHQEDFGQTLAVWGVGSGPYIYLPILGPSTVRDASGFAVDTFGFSSLDFLSLSIEEQRTYYSAVISKYVDIRADLIPVEDLIIGDKYSFLRTIYFQRRSFLINDGVVKAVESEIEDDFDDFGEDFGDDFDESPDQEESEVDEIDDFDSF